MIEGLPKIENPTFVLSRFGRMCPLAPNEVDWLLRHKAFKHENYPSRKKIEESICIDGVTIYSIIELNEKDYADYIEGSKAI